MKNMTMRKSNEKRLKMEKRFKIVLYSAWKWQEHGSLSLSGLLPISEREREWERKKKNKKKSKNTQLEENLSTAGKNNNNNDN